MPTTISVADATIVEGNTGTRYAMVSVTLNAPSRKTVTVQYATGSGTAMAGVDLRSTSGKLTFARGETSKTIAVPVYGDRAFEADESFSIRLSGARNAWISDGRGLVTIVDDEPRLSVDDVRGSVVISEGAIISYPTLRFTVRLATAYDQVVTVDYATADDTANAGIHYVAVSGTLTFAPGETVKTVAVEVISLGQHWIDTLFLNLSNPSVHARIIDGQGVGTIDIYAVQPGDPGDGCDANHPYWPNC